MTSVVLVCIFVCLLLVFPGDKAYLQDPGLVGEFFRLEAW